MPEGPSSLSPRRSFREHLGSEMSDGGKKKPAEMAKKLPQIDFDIQQAYFGHLRMFTPSAFSNCMSVTLILEIQPRSTWRSPLMLSWRPVVLLTLVAMYFFALLVSSAAMKIPQR